MLHVRVASELELMPLVFMGKEYFESEAGRWHDFELNITKAIAHASTALMSSDQEIFVAEKDGTLIGFAWVCLIDQVWTDDLIAQDRFVYVHPKHRDLKAARLLTEALEEWAWDKGAKAVFLGGNGGHRDDRPATVAYKRFGYKPCGAALIKRKE